MRPQRSFCQVFFLQPFLLSLILRVSTMASFPLPPSGIQVIHPKEDSRNYEYICLPNGLQALLISDVTADKVTPDC